MTKSLEILLNDILELEEVKEYLKFKELVIKDPELNSTVSKLKELDKCIKNETDENKINDLVKQYNSISSTLDNNVLYNLYKNSLDSVRDVLYAIKDTIEETL